MFVYKLGCFFQKIVLFFLPVFCFSFNIFLDFSVSMPGKPPSLMIEYNYILIGKKTLFTRYPSLRRGHNTVKGNRSPSRNHDESQGKS